MCQAPLSLLHSACLVLLLLILLLILFLHHLEVKDTGNKHVKERADDRGDDDPKVGQDVVRGAIEHGKADNAEIEEARYELLRDRLISTLLVYLLIASGLGTRSASFIFARSLILLLLV